MDAANAYHGRVLDREAVRMICRYIMTMEAASNEMFVRATQAENMLASYMNEYGDELFDKLAPEEWYVPNESNDVEAEIVEQEQETLGLVYEEPGLDAQVEGEEE